MRRTSKRLLIELLTDSKRSDRELARAIGASQPTVSRIRSKLVNEGLVREFTIIPDFVKLGYEIMAICCVKLRNIIIEPTEKSIEWMRKFPNIIFAARAEGMGKNGVIISLHRNYADYSNFLAEQLEYWKEEIEDYDTMLISLQGIIVKPLSLKYLAQEIKETLGDK